MNAVRTGSIENVIVLLDAGADLEAKDNEGKTALLVAASNAGPDVAKVKLLIERGAEPRRDDDDRRVGARSARKRTDCAPRTSRTTSRASSARRSPTSSILVHAPVRPVGCPR